MISVGRVLVVNSDTTDAELSEPGSASKCEGRPNSGTKVLVPTLGISPVCSPGNWDYSGINRPNDHG